MDELPWHRCKNGRILPYPGVACAQNHFGEDAGLEPKDVLLLLNESLRLLKRLRDWDVMDTGDGEYFRAQIDRVLRGEKGNF